MKTNIRKTLYNNIFIQTPQIKKTEYKNLFQFIFPDVDLFEGFLLESNYEKKIEIAKVILLRLCYEMDFPPPTKILLNLLDMEVTIGSKIKGGFLSKDHFVHLVNLYLLGIVAFFNHNSFNRYTFNLLKFLRTSNENLDNVNISENTIRDFVKSWRIMVLYHDLGYPLEYFIGTKVDQEDYENKKTFIQPFNKINEYIAKDLSTKALSEVIVLWQMLNTTYHKKMHEIIFNFIPNYNSWEKIDRRLKKIPKQEIIKAFKGKARKDTNDSRQFELNQKKVYDVSKFATINAVELDCVFGETSLRIIQTAIGKEKLIPVLRDKSTEEPVILIFPQKDIEKYNIFRTKKNINSHLRFSNDFDLIKFAYCNNAISEKYYWSYFINPEDIKMAKLEEYGGFYSSKLSDVVRYLNKNNHNKFEHISNEYEFKNYCFDIYNSLYNSFGMGNEQDSELSEYEVYLKTTEPIFNDLKKELPNEVSKIFNSIFELEIKKALKKSGANYTNAFQIIGAAFANLFFNGIEHEINWAGKNGILIKEHNSDSSKILEININSFVAKTLNGLSDDIRKKAEIQIYLHSIWKVIRSEVTNYLPPSNISVEFDIKYSDQSHKNDKLKIGELSKFELVKNLFDEIKTNSGIEDSKYNSIEDIFLTNEYKPLFAEENHKESSFIDHGFASSILLAECLNSYNGIISNIRKSKDDYKTELIKFAFGMGEKESAEFNINYRRKLLLIPLYSICMHNIYPKYFIKPFQTLIEKTPFAYFSIFLDSIQPWDRKISYNPAYVNLSYNVYGNKYDIKIVKNKFLIYEEGSGLNLKRRLEELSVHLDEYLKDASHLIIPSLSGIDYKQ